MFYFSVGAVLVISHIFSFHVTWYSYCNLDTCLSKDETRHFFPQLNFLGAHCTVPFTFFFFDWLLSTCFCSFKWIHKRNMELGVEPCPYLYVGDCIASYVGGLSGGPVLMLHSYSLAFTGSQSPERMLVPHIGTLLGQQYSDIVSNTTFWLRSPLVTFVKFSSWAILNRHFECEFLFMLQVIWNQVCVKLMENAISLWTNVLVALSVMLEHESLIPLYDGYPRDLIKS